ncbi:hypothetical protein TVAG_230110 [Trichomonas vaginalis G3]|uniref:Uncharacterized protein n=1 Tax=Trichomonas vaginalis (strain ATCC PRA-98 / G3) TaxID=412133 RepID=A2F0Z9_TRIV3|nr:kinesin-associated proteins family [Trichomonas vaginalis G3]EAY01407.1 hypothetical protein TVAG_230110 [Trichomonas vaginalis G3]KAI5529523.1 kinesin-associated proteins family [Trichomonas vaginalis G3]|eukprot:XP_001314129.1 hypothetical protein [Trichomonas vaginalis G3]
MQSDDDQASLIWQLFIGNIDIIPASKSIVVHYDIQVDVLDSDCNTLFSDSKPSEIKISFPDITPLSNPEEIADIAISKCEALQSCKRSVVVQAISDLAAGTATSLPANPTRSPSIEQGLSKLASTAPAGAVCSESMPVMKPSSSKDDVDSLLHNALQKIHWGDNNECLQTLSSLAEISLTDKNLALIIRHEPLMSALCNNLKKFATSSLPSCIKIMTIFERISYYPDYQSALARFKIGAMSLSLLHVQLHVTQIAASKFTKEDLNAYIKSQNHLIRLTVSLLYNISEDISSMRKMMNKDIISPLITVLKRRDLEILLLSLRLLRRISLIPVNWGDVPFDEIVPAICQDIFRWTPDQSNKRAKIVTVLKEGLELMYTFSFHREVLPNFQKNNVFEYIGKLCDIMELRQSLIKFLYQASLNSPTFESFQVQKIVDLLIHAATSNNQDHVIALVILMRLSTDIKCSQMIAQSPIFTPQNVRQMFVDSANHTSGDSAILLHLIRNIADNQPKLVTGFDDAIVDACIANKDNLEALCDIFAVSSRAKMDSTRAKFFVSKQPFVQLVVSILSSRNSLPQLQLECVMFVSSVVLFSKPAQELEEQGIVKHVVGVFMQYNDDLDIQTQCLFCFYRFVCHTETRKALISHNEIINAVIKHSGSKNSVLSQMANSVLDALVTFDRGWAEKIRKPRFEAFNWEWISIIDKQGTKQ